MSARLCVVGWYFARNHAALEIYFTSLKSLDLDSLQEIRAGRVVVRENEQLCYADYINWGQLMPGGSRISVRNNRNRTLCGRYIFLFFVRHINTLTYLLTYRYFCVGTSLDGTQICISTHPDTILPIRVECKIVATVNIPPKMAASSVISVKRCLWTVCGCKYIANKSYRSKTN